ncbi:MAG: hypothetical protein ACLU9N_01060 [Clostridia bacterium]
MAKDRRVKGCPNETCSMHNEKKKQPAENEYCPKCGSRLIFVCEKCFAEIEDIDYSHKKCKRCEVEAIEKKEKTKDAVKNAAGKVGAAGVAVVGAAAVGIQKEGVKQAAAAGSKVVKEAIKVIPKVIHK